MAYIGGLYTGLSYTAGLVDEPSQVQLLDNYLQAVVDARAEDSVVSVFMMPSAFYTTGLTPSTKALQMQRPTRFGGYTPRNRKLLTYPYNFACVDTLSSSKNYMYEWSSDGGTLHFALICGMSPNPEIVCYPRNYNGSSGDEVEQLNATESVTCSGFPQVAFTIDAYRAWLANRATGDFLNLLGSAVSTGVSFATGNAVSGVLGTVGMASSMSNMVMDATEGSKARGNQGASTDTAIRKKGVYFKMMQVTEQYARMIDSYFDRYGYATCLVKVPNRNVRPHWTYTKTKDAAIRGDVPSDDMARIKSIYDKGITFWKNGSEVGNYNLDNSI